MTAAKRPGGRLVHEAELLAKGAQRAYEAGDYVASLELAVAAKERLQLYAHLKRARELLDQVGRHQSPPASSTNTAGRAL